VFLPPAGAITQNAATAKIKGVETELSARPIPSLELFATLAYLHARYIDFPGAYVDCVRQLQCQREGIE
jgi:iron complex outermembrane receptor protein